MQQELAQWTVIFGSEILPFNCFRAAISYADGRSTAARVVKEIDPSNRVIRLIKDSAYRSQFDDQDGDGNESS